MHRLLVLLVAIFLTSSLPAHSTSSKVIENYVPNAKLVGSGVLSFLFFDVYKASLYSGNKEGILAKPLALKLEYYRELDGKDIAERTVDEMKDLGYKSSNYAKITDKLAAIFPDVKDNDIITGIKTKSESTIFYFADKKIGEINDPYFTKYFFAIWLDPNTSEKKLRKKLLGRK